MIEKECINAAFKDIPLYAQLILGFIFIVYMSFLTVIADLFFNKGRSSDGISDKDDDLFLYRPEKEKRHDHP